MEEHQTKETKIETKADAVQSGKRRKLIIRIVIVAIIAVAIGSGIFWYVSSKTVYIDQSIIQAPLINLSPVNSGVLEQVFVQAGDSVTADEPVARVGNEIVKATTNGEIVTVAQNIGAFENPLTGQAVVATMIDPTQLRVVGHLDENAGLSNIAVGDSATFTVDAFASKKYKGVIDEVAPSSEQSDVVFDISNQRPTNQFDIYVRFDPAEYPELKNGMSARVWVYKQ